MKRELKVAIKKKYILNDRGHYRFYSAIGRGKKAPMLYLDRMDLKSEKELVQLIYKEFGEGEYLLLGYMKGHKGCFVFWRGVINDQGWMFFKKKYNRKEVNEWDKEVKNTEDAEEKEAILELRDEARKIEKNKSEKRRYGFDPFLKRSSNRGEFRFWDDDDLKIKQDNINEDLSWKKENKTELPKWDLKKTKEEELEKW